jgi:hypothetical protein
MSHLGRFTLRNDNSIRGWAAESGQVQKISSLLEFDPWTAKPVASCYTDFTVLALMMPDVFTQTTFFLCNFHSNLQTHFIESYKTLSHKKQQDSSKVKLVLL